MAAVEVRGIVRDITKQPLAGILVQAGEGGPVYITNADGEFIFAAGEKDFPLTVYFISPLFHKERRLLHGKGAPVTVNVFLIPLRQFKEEVAVTALNSLEKAGAVPFAQKVISGVTIREDQPESIVQAVQNSPGVHFIGKGGSTVTPSIRGLARRRILLLVDGARITSDRSAGASAQFFPSEMAGQVEIMRSASSVLYGSDAIGGVIQVIAAPAGDPGAGVATLNFSGHSADEKRTGGFSLRGKVGELSLLAALQVSRAGDYASGSGNVLNSGYSYYTGRLAVDYETADRGIRLSFLGSAGRDIGKPDRANDRDVSSFYPAENTRLLNLTYREDGFIANGSLNFSFFVNANDYELHKVKQAQRQLEISRNNACDYGWRAFLKQKLPHRLSLQAGVDYYGRIGVDMENETWRQGVLSDSSVPLADGRRSDMGVYSTLAWSAPAGFELLAGGRMGAFSRSAVSAGTFQKKSSLAPAFFLGVTRKFAGTLTLFVNAGTAFRLPSLSESFYTGITGRSTIVANPALEPEKSLNLDAGIKIQRRDFFVGVYAFRYAIRGMIEKFPLADSAYTYGNIERGCLSGLELEFQCFPLKKLEVFGNGFYYRGNGNGGALNDVPSARFLMGTKLWLGRLWGEVDWLAAAALRRPGPAEVAVDAYHVVDLKAGCYFSDRVFLFAKIANLFNRAYYANGDPDIPLARGIDLAVGLNLNF